MHSTAASSLAASDTVACRVAAFTRRARVLFLAALALFAGGFGVPLVAVADTSTPRNGPQDAAEFGVFLDGLLAGLLPERHLPGAVVVAVKDGKVFFAKGYGVADRESGRAVDPATTLFRVASVSKLLTATAVMQLVEQGRLDLDTDVNERLEGFRLDATFASPVTLAHLLTHTGGFDDSFLGSVQPLDADRVSLAAHLARHMPPRVQPPGELISYSNYGVALAGHLVERASGQSFDDYVREHVLGPLGMTHSGFGLPNPPPAELATGYAWTNEHYVAATSDRLRMGPAGDLYTSGLDMAHFMLAHLQHGVFGGVTLLRPETIDQMHARRFSNHPDLDGWCLGFMERTRSSVRTIGHGGSWNGFGTELVLVPEANFGLFVSTTRDNDMRFFERLLGAIFERYFRASETPQASAAPDDAARARLAALEGHWIPNRRIRGDFLALGTLLGESTTSVDDGVLVIHPAAEIDPQRLVSRSDDVFAIEGTQRRVAFRGATSGAPARLFVDQWSFDRVNLFDAPSTHRLLGVVCIVTFVATLLGFGFGALVRALFGGPASGIPRAARALAMTVSGLDLVVLGGVLGSLSTLSPFALMQHVPWYLVALGLVPLLSLPASLAVPFFLWRSRSSRSWTPLARIHFGLLTFACVAFAFLAVHYRVIGIRGIE